MDCSSPGSSTHGILQARILEWVAIPFSRESRRLRDRTGVSCTAGRFFTAWVTREALVCTLSTSNYALFSFGFSVIFFFSFTGPPSRFPQLALTSRRWKPEREWVILGLCIPFTCASLPWRQTQINSECLIYSDGLFIDEQDDQEHPYASKKAAACAARRGNQVREKAVPSWFMECSSLEIKHTLFVIKILCFWVRLPSRC